MRLFALGLNQHTAPLSIREQLAFPAVLLPKALDSLVRSRAAREAAIVSTCNRTEIYFTGGDPQAALSWLAKFHGLVLEEMLPYLYQLEERKAARHAFRVASGLDSMVLGETQIFGQLKDAVRIAEQAGTMGTLLNGLFQRTFAVAKEVRSNTAVGANSVSMSAASVKLVEQFFPSIGELNILFVGAGAMIELVATHFASRNPSRITVANRTLERGQRLADQFGGDAVTLSKLPDILSSYDVLVTSTASQLPIIRNCMVENAIKTRRHRPIFMLDLAVPRDIEVEVGQLQDVFLYSLDDISSVVEVGREARQIAAAEAETIIEARVSEFSDWLKKRETVPLIRALRDDADRMRRAALDAALKQLARGETPERVLEKLSVQLTNKLMHPPTRALSSGRGAEHEAQVEVVSRLYRLHPES